MKTWFPPDVLEIPDEDLVPAARVADAKDWAILLETPRVKLVQFGGVPV